MKEQLKYFNWLQANPILLFIFIVIPIPLILHILQIFLKNVVSILIAFSIFATFSYGNAVDKLLLDVMQKCHKEIENKDCSIVIGNPEQVKEPFLRNLAMQKKTLILKTVQEKLKVTPLEEASLTVEVLRTILSQIKPSPQSLVLFSSQASAVSSHQPLNVAADNDSASSSLSNEVDKKKLSGAL